MAEKYLSAPLPSDRMPSGIPYIVGNEAAERFSYYGMRGILVIFMTKYLMGRHQELEVMSEADAEYWYHIFLFFVYFFPVIGSIVADGLLGKYRTIISLSLVYCLGHAALAIDDTRWGLAIGLGLIAIGAGGIKPCVSAHVGDQFGKDNQNLLEKVYAWFYFSINFGSFFSQLLIPWLLEKYGPSVAFGVPGILMALATLCFWLGRYKFVHVPPSGMGFLRDMVSLEGRRALLGLISVYLFVIFFWSLYDQTGSTWVLQAEKMDRVMFGVEVSSAQIQAVNSILVLLFIPLFTYVVYPAISLVFPLTPLRKIGIGLFIMAAAFCVSALIEGWIVAGETPHIGWQFLAYVVLTASEVMVSITGLEFSYTQAPKNLKSVVMSLWLLTVSLGNLLTAQLNAALRDSDGNPRVTGPDYYWMFAGMMAVAAVVFVFVAMRFRGHAYIQGEAPTATA